MKSNRPTTRLPGLPRLAALLYLIAGTGLGPGVYRREIREQYGWGREATRAVLKRLMDLRLVRHELARQSNGTVKSHAYVAVEDVQAAIQRMQPDDGLLPIRSLPIRKEPGIRRIPSTEDPLYGQPCLKNFPAGASTRRVEVIQPQAVLQASATPMACAPQDSDSGDWWNPPTSEPARNPGGNQAVTHDRRNGTTLKQYLRSQDPRERDNPYSAPKLLGWMDDWHLDVVEMDLGNQEDDLRSELTEAYPDATLCTLIRQATGGRVHRSLLTAAGLYAARYLAAIIMSRARAGLAARADHADIGAVPEDDSLRATPQGAMQVILKAMWDRIGSRPGQWMRSYAVIGKRLAGALYSGYVPGQNSRLYRPRVTEEQLTNGTGGDDALRIVRELGGWKVLVPELRDGPEAIAALCAFLGEEARKNGCRRVDVLAAVVRVMRSFVSHGWHDGERRQNVPVSSWSHLAKAVAADMKKQRSKAAC